MLASKPNPSGVSEGASHKQPSNRRATSAPRVSRLTKPAIKPADRAPSPLHRHAALDRSSASIDLPKPSPSPGGAAERRRSFIKPSPASSRGSTTTDKQQPTRSATARTSSELQLQAQLSLVQEDLRNARDRLASIENDRAQILDDLAAARRLAADATAKLEDSVLARRRAEEALELERFKSTEREQSALDLAQRKYENIRKRHAEDVASLIATARELDAARDELAATKDAALSQAHELQEIADGSAKKAGVLTAEVARLEKRAKEAEGTIEKMGSELRAELRNAKESLVLLSKSSEEKQAQILRLHQDKVAALEKEAGEYKQRFLDTSRLLDVATEEAIGLHTAIGRLKSEHQLLQEAHQQAVLAEKTAVGQLTEDKNRLLRELADTRGEREKAKKAVEDLAAALRKVSAEGKEMVLAKQAEVDGARVQMAEELKNAEERHRLRIEELSYENECLRKTVERMGSEAKVLKDEWVSKEAGFVDMLKRSEDGISSIQMEMNRLMESLRAAENEVQELRADKTQLLSKLQGFEAQATNTADEEAKAESSHLKDLLTLKDKELLALNHELTELRLREMAARKAEEESTEKYSKALQAAKLEMDSVLESLKAEAKAAKEEKAQLQTKLRLLESKITEANLSSEEAKIRSLRLKETLEDKEQEMARIVQENREMRAREAAAHAKIDELALLLAEASTARKGGGEVSNGVVTRIPEKQHSVLFKLICPPMHQNVQDDENNGEMIQNQKEDIKHVEMETVRQVKHEKESGVAPSAVLDANSLENSKIIEDDLNKERDDDDSDSSDEDDDVESTGDDVLVDQMNGLLIHGTTSSFNRDQQHVQKKKRALLKKFGSLLKKKTHFTMLNSHSHS